MRLLNCAFGELLEAVDEVEAVDDVLDSHANKSSSLEVDDVAELDVCSWAPPPPCTCPVFLESSSVDEVDAVDEVDDEFDVEDVTDRRRWNSKRPGAGQGATLAAARLRPASATSRKKFLKAPRRGRRGMFPDPVRDCPSNSTKTRFR